MSTGWLAQLSAAHAPPPPGWWPVAPGWWVLVGSLVLLVSASTIWWLSPRYRLLRGALRELDSIVANDADAVRTSRAIQNLLRRYAVAAFGKRTVGRLSGDAWIGFLNSHNGGRFDPATAGSLLSAAFGNPQGDNREDWVAGAEAFLRGVPRARRTEQ
jgi:Domain of unknown function (DUF4381)